MYVMKHTIPKWPPTVRVCLNFMLLVPALPTIRIVHQVLLTFTEVSNSTHFLKKFSADVVVKTKRLHVTYKRPENYFKE